MKAVGREVLGFALDRRPTAPSRDVARRGELRRLDSPAEPTTTEKASSSRAGAPSIRTNTAQGAVRATASIFLEEPPCASTSRSVEVVRALDTGASRGTTGRARSPRPPRGSALRGASRRRRRIRRRDPGAHAHACIHAEPSPEAARRRRRSKDARRRNVPLLQRRLRGASRPHGLHLGGLLQAREGLLLIFSPLFRKIWKEYPR